MSTSVPIRSPTPSYDPLGQLRWLPAELRELIYAQVSLSSGETPFQLLSPCDPTGGLRNVSRALRHETQGLECRHAHFEHASRDPEADAKSHILTVDLKRIKHWMHEQPHLHCYSQAATFTFHLTGPEFEYKARLIRSVGSAWDAALEIEGNHSDRGPPRGDDKSLFDTLVFVWSLWGIGAAWKIPTLKFTRVGEVLPDTIWPGTRVEVVIYKHDDAWILTVSLPLEDLDRCKLLTLKMKAHEAAWVSVE